MLHVNLSAHLPHSQERALMNTIIEDKQPKNSSMILLVENTDTRGSTMKEKNG